MEKLRVQSKSTLDTYSQKPPKQRSQFKRQTSDSQLNEYELSQREQRDPPRVYKLARMKQQSQSPENDRGSARDNSKDYLYKGNY